MKKYFINEEYIPKFCNQCEHAKTTSTDCYCQKLKKKVTDYVNYKPLDCPICSIEMHDKEIYNKALRRVCIHLAGMVKQFGGIYHLCDDDIIKLAKKLEM